MATATFASSRATHLPSAISHEPVDESIPQYYCRALYDYQSTDSSSLSFYAGEIIEVLTQLDSGWWDGLLNDERGWFPSNYVELISPDELALHQSMSDSEAYDSGIDMSHNDDRRDDYQSEVDWGRQQQEYSQPIQNANGHAAPIASSTPNDYWVPRMTDGAQIYYVNTRTGEQSRDLPSEVDDIDEMQDFALLNGPVDNRNGRTVSNNGGASLSNGTNGNHAGFGVSQRSGTPEPWVRRLADDGMSYYYLNTQDGQVQWTRPAPLVSSASTTTLGTASTATRVERRPTDVSQTSVSSSLPSSAYAPAVASRDNSFEPTANRLRSDSTSSYTHAASSSSKRFSVYSDDSDIQPRDLDDPPLRRVASSDKRKGRNGIDHGLLDDTRDERAASLLRKALEPPEPERVEDLADKVREAIRNVAHAVGDNTTTNGSAMAMEVDDLVAAVVVSVRNLLSCSGALAGGVHDERSTGDVTAAAAIHHVHNKLKTSQRKVTATLSKLVLSARAARFKRESLSMSMMIRVDQDVVDLQHTVDGFVADVQQAYAEPVVQQYHERFGRKRLKGVFGLANIGPGIPGGGAGGTWKGFGYVPLQDNVHVPGRTLDDRTVSEVQSSAITADEKLANLSPILAANQKDSVFGVADALAHLSAFTLLVQDINIAQHVDVDGIRREQQDVAPDDPYLQAVNYARALMRSFEIAVQTVYDDGSYLLTQIQTLSANHDGLRRQKYLELINATLTALRMELKKVQEIVGKLLVLGHEQADTAHIDYRGSIDWRMSQISVLNGSQPLSHLINELPDECLGDVDAVVGIEDAFLHRPPPRQGSSGIEPDIVESPIELSRSNAVPASAAQYHLEMQQQQRLAAQQVSQSSQKLHVPEIVTPPAEVPQRNGVSPLPGGFSRPSPPPSINLDDELLELIPEKVVKSPQRGTKIKQILGDDAPQRYIDKQNADSKPWYLRLDHGPNEVLENPDGGIRGGTLPALVERLTTHEYGDTIFIKTFLMTFKSFTTLNELFDLLVLRFRMPAPQGLTPKEMEEWTKLKQHFVRLRVLNTFKAMVTDEDCLEKDDYYIFDRMREFVSSPEVSQMSAAKHLLSKLIDRARNGTESIVKMTPAVGSAPPSIVPKVSSSRRVKLLDIDALEMARQLTILESRLYNKVRAIECLQRAREQRTGDNPDHIADIIQVANKIAYWVAQSILSKEDSRKRANIIKQFIMIADRCRTLHNFSSMVAIISGLNMPPIRRLKRTWEQVNNRAMSQLGTCEMTLDSAKNFANYRATIAKVSPPCIPFFGFYLSNLTFIQDGSKDMLPGNLINFGKRQKAAEVIWEIKHWQSKPFNLNPVPSVQAFIEESMNEFSDTQDWSEIFWNQSLEREPREREDERMARLLQESGFL